MRSSAEVLNQERVAGAKCNVAGVGPLLVVYLIGLAGAKPLMGAGDVKLMAGVGAFAGPWGTLWSLYYALWIAGGLAVVTVGWFALRRAEIPKTMPFGACLAFGTVVALIYRTEAFSPVFGQMRI